MKTEIQWRRVAKDREQKKGKHKCPEMCDTNENIIHPQKASESSDPRATHATKGRCEVQW